jgi:phosphoglycerate dehydrogenase-like enzyme
MKVVVLDSLFDSLELEQRAAAERSATLQRWDGDPTSLAEADVVAHVRTRIDADLIAAMQSCRVITRFGTGVDTVDLAAAATAGIAVVTVHGYCVPELPAHTLALALTLVRRLSATIGAVDASWQTIASETPISRFRQATVVGLGEIGERVASALDALGFAVSVVTRHGQDMARRRSWPLLSLEEGLAEADIVFLHTMLDESTRALIDQSRTELMREGAILVNTARLGLLDEAAIAAALDRRRLGGLALDAQLSPESPLRRFADDRRVLITPHIGWYSNDSAANLRTAAIANALDRATEHSHQEVGNT